MKLKGLHSYGWMLFTFANCMVKNDEISKLQGK